MRARGIIGADHDAVGMLEVLNCGALAQKLRIGDDLQFGIRTHLAQDLLNLVAGPDRHGRFGDDHRRLRQVRSNLAHRLVDEAQIGVAVAAAGRRADSDEDGVGFGDARRLVSKFQPALADVGFDEVRKSRLEDRNFALLERGDPARILVDAGDLMAEIGKAGAGDEPDITGADHANAHYDLRFGSDLVRTGRRRGGAFEFIERRRRRGVRALPRQRKPAPPEQADDQRAVEGASEHGQHDKFRTHSGTWAAKITDM